MTEGGESVYMGARVVCRREAVGRGGAKGREQARRERMDGGAGAG